MALRQRSAHHLRTSPQDRYRSCRVYWLPEQFLALYRHHLYLKRERVADNLWAIQSSHQNRQYRLVRLDDGFLPQNREFFQRRYDLLRCLHPLDDNPKPLTPDTFFDLKRWLQRSVRHLVPSLKTIFCAIAHSLLDKGL